MKKRVLFVDDVQYNIEFESKVVESLQKELGITIEVDSANTLQDAKKMIANSMPYDAMIVDMNLPDGSGVEVAKAAFHKSETTRLAALTIYPSKYQEFAAFFDLFLRKPIMPTDFKEALMRLLKI